MTPMLFDLIIVGLLILSVALGFARGFCKEVFTIFGWVAAIIATIYFTPVMRQYGRQMIEKEWMADLATSATIFLFTLLVCSVVSYFATRTLHATKLGIVDRSLGFLFGILRAVVILGLAYILFQYTFSNPETRPAFVTEARTKPFLDASSKWLQAIMPPLEKMVNESDRDSIDDLIKPEEIQEQIEKEAAEQAVEIITNQDDADKLKQTTIPEEKNND